MVYSTRSKKGWRLHLPNTPPLAPPAISTPSHYFPYPLRSSSSVLWASRGLPSWIASHMGYTLDLDFSPGAAFAEKVYDCYGSMIQPSDESGHLTMVVSFNRHSFRLNEDSVAATWKQLLVVMRLIYWSHALRTWSSHSMFRASRLVLSFLIFGLTLARNSNVFSIFGVREDPIGYMSLPFGRKSVMLNGSLLVLLNFLLHNLKGILLAKVIALGLFKLKLMDVLWLAMIFGLRNVCRFLLDRRSLFSGRRRDRTSILVLSDNLISPPS